MADRFLQPLCLARITTFPADLSKVPAVNWFNGRHRDEELSRYVWHATNRVLDEFQ